MLFQSEDAQTRSDFYRQQGENLFDEEKYEESLLYYQKAFNAIKDTDKVRAANLCNDISSVYYGLNQFDQSITECRKGIGLLKESTTQPDSLYFKLYSSLGTMFHRKALTDSSNYYFLLSDKLLEDNKQLSDEIPEYVLHHYLNQGRAVWRKHRYYDSINYFEKARALCRRHKMYSELFYIYSSLGEVYDLLKQHEKALEWRLLAVKQIPKERIQSLISLYTGVGNTYNLLNQKDSAMVWLNKSLRTISQSPNQNENYQVQYLYIKTELADIHLQNGNFEECRKLLHDAEKLYRKSGLDRAALHSRILLAMGDYEKKAGNTDGAMKYYDRAYRKLLSDSTKADSDDLRFVRYPKFALKTLEAQTSIHNIRYKKRHDPEELESAFRLYSRLIDIKKQSYREVATSIDDRFNYTANTQPLMEEAIQNGFEYYQIKKTEGALNSLFNRFEDANTTYLMDIVSSSSGTHQDYILKSPLELSKIKKQMDDQSVFLTYKLVGNQLIALAISKNKTEVKNWPIDLPRFNSDIESLLLEVKMNPGLGKYAGSPAAQRCYDVLIRPLEEMLRQYKRWIVVRDWKFSTLPFELLETNPNRYLGDQKRISYAYSASLFWFHPHLKSSLPKNRDLFVFAPFVQEKGRDSTVGGWKVVSTVNEVKEMGQQYLLGKEASKQNFTGQAHNHYIINLATHAFADIRNPNSSYVQFYPGIDSKLYLEEIMEMKLDNTRLVMLSSCFGNEGATIAGEGTVSLAYAFAQAGCPTLITTNWEANETTISYLTLQISKYIESGIPLDEAVQKARIDLRKNDKFGKYDHPYFWANLSLIGNNGAVYRSPDLLSEYRYLVLIPAIICLVFLLARRYYFRKDV